MNHMLHMLYSSLLFSFEFYLTFFWGGGWGGGDDDKLLHV